MSVDAGMAEITQKMQDKAGGGPAASFDVGVGLDLRIGRLVNLLEQDRQRRQLLGQLVNIIDMPPLDFSVAGNVVRFKAYRASASDNSPQEGLVWFVQRVTVGGLNAGDVVNLHRTVSGTVTASLTSLHTFTGPAAVTAGLGIADWEPGTTALALRPDDQLLLVSAGTVAATELVMTGQAIQVHMSMLAEFLL